jgi:hypothetical protein
MITARGITSTGTQAGTVTVKMNLNFRVKFKLLNLPVKHRDSESCKCIFTGPHWQPEALKRY